MHVSISHSRIMVFYHRFDGFSISAPILWHLDGVQSQDMVSFEYVDRSQLLNSTTMVVRAKDVYLHPHFSEIDRLDENSDTRIMYSVPATALDFNTTYVVIVQSMKLALYTIGVH